MRRGVSGPGRRGGLTGMKLASEYANLVALRLKCPGEARSLNMSVFGCVRAAPRGPHHVRVCENKTSLWFYRTFGAGARMGTGIRYTPPAPSPPRALLSPLRLFGASLPCLDVACHARMHAATPSEASAVLGLQGRAHQRHCLRYLWPGKLKWQNLQHRW